MTPLRLGADTIAMLIPHRRPFLFLDAIDGVELSSQPKLTGFKHVSASEPVFEGHFPGLSLWPGVYTIEGLGQTSNALDIILAIVRGAEAEGFTREDALEALKAIEARARLGGRPPSPLERGLLGRLGGPRQRMGFAGALDMKLIEPVFAGATLRYEVTLTHEIANARRYDVKATVKDRPVARGTLTSAVPPVFQP